MSARDSRFAFGRNWRRFLSALDEDRIAEAEKSLTSILEVRDLRGKSFLDVGCGSGLFSLAARRLGAAVRSFDIDAECVACAAELKRRYFPGDSAWAIEQASALDLDYLKRVGTFDVVYSWGVLHHTGDLWRALAEVAQLVAEGGKLFVAIYNDQGRTSTRWRLIKRTYNALPRGMRFLILWPAFARLWGPTMIRDLLRGRPFSTWRNYARSSRGMSPWRDAVDWVGGYPFEVARPEEVFDFCRARGFALRRLKTCAGGRGCNEFVFQRASG